MELYGLCDARQEMRTLQLLYISSMCAGRRFLLRWTSQGRRRCVMNEMKKGTPISAGWYLLGGLAVGAAAGRLLAPQSGRQTRDDVGEWGRRNREKARSLLARVRGVIPMRTKTVASVGRESFSE